MFCNATEFYVKFLFCNVCIFLLNIAARSTEKYLHIIDMNNPASPSILMTHVFDNAVDGMITSVKACTDTIAVTLTAADPVAEGHIELFTPYNRADRVFTRVGRIAGKPKHYA